MALAYPLRAAKMSSNGSFGSMKAAGKAGTGLGLRLVQAVADLHGGRFELDDTSTTNKDFPGLCATIILPVQGKT